MPAGPRHRPARLRFWPVWWATFVSFVAVGVVWNLAQPLLSGADEPVHFLEAEAVWTGQILPKVVAAPTLPMKVGVLHVRALSHDDVDCYNHHADRPASCAGTFRVSARAETTTSYIGREPPLPAFLNGLPVFLAPGPAGLVMGRILDAVISSACLATALAYAALRRRPFLAVGIVVAFVPCALAETGVLGSSQLEVGAAVLVWTLVAVLLDGERPTRPFVTLLTVSAAALALARPISFVWLALAGLALLVGSHRRRLVGLLRARPVRVGLPVVVAAVAVGVGWYFLATAPDNPAFPARLHHLPGTTLGDLSVVLRGVRTDWLEMLGQTGGDYSGPWGTALLWTALIGLVVGLGLLWSSRRRVVVVVGLIVVFLALPTAVKTVELPHLWLFWHGRYDIPTLSGVVIVAAAALDRVAGRVNELGRLPTAVVTLAGLGQIAEFVGALRRFTVGEDGSLDPLVWYRGWHPPIPAVVLLPLGVLVIAAAYGIVHRVQRAVLTDLRARSDPPRPQIGPAARR